jgi:hypothetical protein
LYPYHWQSYQLDVFRWKQFTVESLTPLDRLLEVGNNVQDNLILEVKCADTYHPLNPSGGVQ